MLTLTARVLIYALLVQTWELALRDGTFEDLRAPLEPGLDAKMRERIERPALMEPQAIPWHELE